jgi:hypothetical protein
MEIKINNIKGITISEMSNKLMLRPQTIKSALRLYGIKPIGYIGSAGIYPDTALKVVQERDTHTGRPAQSWQPKEANSASS